MLSQPRTWGHTQYGGDSSPVQSQLKNVQHIAATDRAFAAILLDGSVVTWGDASSGGDSSSVHQQLKGVQKIRASKNAFAAILGDGSVVTWGHVFRGGDSSSWIREKESFLVTLTYGKQLPVGSYPTPFLRYLLFFLTDPNHKTRYPKKGVGHEPPR